MWTPDDHTRVLKCRKETGNISDLYAVAVVNDQGSLLGHVPRNISAVCSTFLLRSGTITCKVSGSRKYSADLPQGGLELPCRLTFSGNPTKINKISKLLREAPTRKINDKDSNNEPPLKRIKTERGAPN